MGHCEWCRPCARELMTNMAVCRRNRAVTDKPLVNLVLTMHLRGCKDSTQLIHTSVTSATSPPPLALAPDIRLIARLYGTATALTMLSTKLNARQLRMYGCG